MMKARICTGHSNFLVVYEEDSTEKAAEALWGQIYKKHNCPVCRMERELREVMREVDRMSRMLTREVELEEEIQRLEAGV